MESVTGVFEKMYFERRLAQYLLDASGNLHKHIVLLGNVEKRVVFNHLLTTRLCLVNPSWDSEPEAFSVSLLEAQALGVPTITVWRGGQAEAVKHGKTGFCLQSTEENHVVRMMEAIVNDDKKWTLFSHNATEWVLSRFNENIVADRWERYLGLILNKRRFVGNRLNALTHKTINKIERCYWRNIDISNMNLPVVQGNRAM